MNALLRIDGEDRIVEVPIHYKSISFNVTLARRILEARKAKVGRHRITANGNSRLIGDRAELQRKVLGEQPAIVGTVMQQSIVLEGRDRMDATPGNPRFFPAFILTDDETSQCVVPYSRRAFAVLRRMLATPAI